MAELEGEMAYRLEVEEDKDRGTLVITFKDSCLNYSSTDTLKPALKEIVAAALARGRKNIVVSLRNVGVVDSCGLSVLISLKKQIEGQGGQMALSGLNGMIQKLFGITRLDRAFSTYDNEASAVAALAK